MTQEKKLELFREMLMLENFANENRGFREHWLSQCDGARRMLKILGLCDEYDVWSLDGSIDA